MATSDGNAESLYMQGVGLEASPGALPGQGGVRTMSLGAALHPPSCNPHSVVSSHAWTVDSFQKPSGLSAGLHAAQPTGSCPLPFGPPTSSFSWGLFE